MQAFATLPRTAPRPFPMGARPADQPLSIVEYCRTVDTGNHFNKRGAIRKAI